ncbi:MAG TPA: response regulator [Anaerolineae bacterium]|nr:response regulator [Anaerolineae bacterium]
MATGGSSSQRQLRVLIADDIQENRRNNRLMLTQVPGLKIVAIAQNGRQAVELARKHRPDIILMDVNMPEMNGLEAIQNIIRYQPEIVCVVISAERDTQTLLDAMASGARGYLLKPYTVDQFVQVMHRAARISLTQKQRGGQSDVYKQQRDAYLQDLAVEYVNTRRTDDKARQVLEEMAKKADCDGQFLVALANLYLVNRDWNGVKRMAARLEQMDTAS